MPDDAWNETLRRAGKTWKVRQIGDLEVYPDQKHGFRFIGTRGKVVLADKEIGTVQWGNFARGQHKGQAKYRLRSCRLVEVDPVW